MKKLMVQLMLAMASLMAMMGLNRFKGHIPVLKHKHQTCTGAHMNTNIHTHEGERDASRLSESVATLLY